MKRIQMLAVLAVGVALIGFRGVAAQAQPLRVMATTSILADVAAQVAGDYARVESLLPPDTDAHIYEPTTDDALRLSRADLLLTVGAGYESFVQRLIDNAGADVPVIEASAGVTILRAGGHHEGEDPTASEPLGVLGTDVECGVHSHEQDEATASSDEHTHGDCDPHTWMNPLNVIIWAQNIADALAAADPANADAYRENADLYCDELQALDIEIAGLVEQLPPENRRLITSHESLQYFASRYGFEVVATVLPGANSGGELDPQSLAALIAQVQAENVPVVFAEITANTALAETVASEAGIQLVSDLYIEALSEPDGPASTYLDLMRYNAQRIVGALASA
ncbi:MAG TPA: zinc ABC transporter substrate-binding protein [Candidatus Limnocylindrales bacterium]|nr:zinc ABC transporter substrate-binding protein [Candidatus Limnocylindrales bacterium]